MLNKIRSQKTETELTERKSQPDNFPNSEALRILSFLADQSSPDKASLALGVLPFAYVKKRFVSSELPKSRDIEKYKHFFSLHPWLCI